MQVILSLAFVCLQAGDATTSFPDAVALAKEGKGELLDGKDVVWEGYVHPSEHPKIGFLVLRHKLVSGQKGDLVLAHVTYSRKEYFQVGQQIKVLGRCAFKDGHFEVEASKVLYPFE